MKISIKVIALACLVFSACSKTNEVINIDCTTMTEGTMDDSFWRNMSAAVTEVECEQPIMDITDYYAMDSTCLVLTVDGRLISFNMKNGEKHKEIQRRGHSKGEMLNPLSIAGNKEYWYIYDVGKQSIIKLDKDLNYADEIKIEGYFEKFEVSNDGIAGYHIVPDGAFLTFYDINEGKQQYEKRISSIMYEDCSSGFYPLVKDAEGTVYVKADWSDSIFVVSPKDAELKYVINQTNSGSAATSKELLKAENASTLSYFVFENHLLFSAIDNKKVAFRLYNNAENTCHSFEKTPKLNNAPLFAKRQMGNTLLCIKPKMEWSPSQEPDDKVEYKLICISYNYEN